MRLWKTAFIFLNCNIRKHNLVHRLAIYIIHGLKLDSCSACRCNDCIFEIINYKHSYTTFGVY